MLGYSDQRYIIGDGQPGISRGDCRVAAGRHVRFERRLLAIRRQAEWHVRADDSTIAANARDVDAAIGSCWRCRSSCCAGWTIRAPNSMPPRSTHRQSRLRLSYETASAVRQTRMDAAAIPGRSRRAGRFGRRCGCKARSIIRSASAAFQGYHRRLHRGDPAMLDTPPMPYAQIADSPAVERHVREFFEMLDRIWPGVARTGTAKRRSATRKPIRTFCASYVCGSSASARRLPVRRRAAQGDVHFAGEHTSVDISRVYGRRRRVGRSRCRRNSRATTGSAARRSRS